MFSCFCSHSVLSLSSLEMLYRSDGMKPETSGKKAGFSSATPVNCCNASNTRAGGSSPALSFGAAAGWGAVAEILLLSLAPSWEIHSSLLLCNCAGVGSGIFRLLIALEGLWWDQIPDLEGRWEAPEGSHVQLMMCRFKTGKHVPIELFFPKHCTAAY